MSVPLQQRDHPDGGEDRPDHQAGESQARSDEPQGPAAREAEGHHQGDDDEVHQPTHA